MTNARIHEYVYNVLAAARESAYRDLGSATNAGCHEDTIAAIKTGITEITELMIERDKLARNVGKETPTPQAERDVRAELQKRADYNRENADDLYGDTLYYGYKQVGYFEPEDGKENKPLVMWRERSTDKPVVFTPYGWRLQEDVEKETGETL